MRVPNRDFEYNCGLPVGGGILQSVINLLIGKDFIERGR